MRQYLRLQGRVNMVFETNWSLRYRSVRTRSLEYGAPKKRGQLRLPFVCLLF